MKLRLLRKLLTAAVFGLSMVAPAMAAPQWVPLKNEVPAAKSVTKEENLEVLALPSMIILNLEQTANVEVFTILGRLLLRETLHPGNYEFTVDAHGVYILKIGDLTCKVAI